MENNSLFSLSSASSSASASFLSLPRDRFDWICLSRFQSHFSLVLSFLLPFPLTFSTLISAYETVFPLSTLSLPDPISSQTPPSSPRTERGVRVALIKSNPVSLSSSRKSRVIDWRIEIAAPARTPPWL